MKIISPKTLFPSPENSRHSSNVVALSGLNVFLLVACAPPDRRNAACLSCAESRHVSAICPNLTTGIHTPQNLKTFRPPTPKQIPSQSFWVTIRNQLNKKIVKMYTEWSLFSFILKNVWFKKLSNLLLKAQTNIFLIFFFENLYLIF